MTKPRAGIQSVEVGFALLDTLAASRSPMMLRDLAAAAHMSAAKAHRYLVSFQRLTLVVQDAHSTRYDLGPAALKLGLASLGRLDAVQLARARMGDLMAQIGQTLAIAVWGNHGPTIVHWQQSPQTITVNLRLGDVMPLLTSATGRCFAAYAPPPAIAPLIKAELQTLAQQRTSPANDAPRTLTQAKTLLADTRAHGLGRVCHTLLPGIAGFCAPVFDSNGHMVMGLVTLGSTASFDDRWDGIVARHLKAAAQHLSQDLGYGR